MELPSYFIDFLSGIRLTSYQINEMMTGHKTLRERLKEDEKLSKIKVATFLQGSYGRYTAVRPKGNDKSDVDIIIVTRLDTKEYSPKESMDLFIPFLEKYYKDKFEIQRRSLGIKLSYIDLDLVVTVAPSESEEGLLKKMEGINDLSTLDMISGIDSPKVKAVLQETLALKEDSPQWKKVPLCLPDREADDWIKTHPIEQIRWTIEKNAKTSGHYINVVKALKWWRKFKYPDVKQPKSYPFEHFIGDCCPNDIKSVAEGITLTLEEIKQNHKIKPILEDRGVPEHDVFGRLSYEEYSEFYSQVSDAAVIAREALDSNEVSESAIKWKELFGNKFPDPPQENREGGFTPRKEKTKNVPKGRFA